MEAEGEGGEVDRGKGRGGKSGRNEGGTMLMEYS
jgi:hypothetical protein